MTDSLYYLGVVERAKLMGFYGVSTLEALVDAQARHIEKLQSREDVRPIEAPVNFPRGA